MSWSSQHLPNSFLQSPITFYHNATHLPTADVREHPLVAHLPTATRDTHTEHPSSTNLFVANLPAATHDDTHREQPLQSTAHGPFIPPSSHEMTRTGGLHSTEHLKWSEPRRSPWPDLAPPGFLACLGRIWALIAITHIVSSLTRLAACARWSWQIDRKLHRLCVHLLKSIVAMLVRAWFLLERVRSPRSPRRMPFARSALLLALVAFTCSAALLPSCSDSQTLMVRDCLQPLNSTSALSSTGRSLGFAAATPTFNCRAPGLPLPVAPGAVSAACTLDRSWLSLPRKLLVQAENRVREAQNSIASWWSWLGQAIAGVTSWMSTSCATARTLPGQLVVQVQVHLKGRLRKLLLALWASSPAVLTSWRAQDLELIPLRLAGLFSALTPPDSFSAAGSYGLGIVDVVCSCTSTAGLLELIALAHPSWFRVPNWPLRFDALVVLSAVAGMAMAIRLFGSLPKCLCLIELSTQWTLGIQGSLLS